MRGISKIDVIGAAAWQVGRAYAPGDLVLHSGRLWRAVAKTLPGDKSPPPASLAWTLVVTTDAGGIDKAAAAQALDARIGRGV